MTPEPEFPVRDAPSEAGFLPVLILLFIGSGCAALIYEVVWFQMLQLVIGSTGISLGVLLGAFMAGMCIGSLALPRFVPIDRHPLRVYAVLELAIAAVAIALLGLIPLVGGAYVAIVPSGLASVLFRALLAGLLLLPPTILMGATLPAIARYVEATPRGVSWMGFFYGGNIAGAVAGCLLAGFYLLREYDTVVATFAAAGINVVVATLAVVLATTRAHRPTVVETVEAPTITSGRHRTILIAIGLSGFVALGSEVVWTRLMALMLGATTYTFSIILAVFLAALGVGSAVGSYVSRHSARPRTLFGLCQAGAVVGVAWTAHAIAEQLPFWPINPSIAYEPAFVFQLDLARALWALAPAPLLWGASFPLAVAAAAEKGQDPAALLGRVYAANTIGAICGAILFGIVMVSWFGTQNAQRALIIFSALSALLLLAPVLLRAPEGRDGWPARVRLPVAGAGVVVAILLIVGVSPIPPVLIAYGRYAPTYDPPVALYVGEGRNSSVAVTELSDGTRNLHIGGKVVASTEQQDMRLQGMLGHLTALLHDDPKSVLVVGFGAGVTAGTFVTHPGIERIVIAEIEPLIVRQASSYFTEANNAVLDDPRVEVVFDDARHFLLTTDERFDLITSDPIHPWMKGAAALYSEEYFRLASKHLNEGGVITQWVPLYESSTEAVKSEMATFFQAFPEGTVWGNTYDGSGYDVVMAAKAGPMEIDLDRFVARLQSPDHSLVAMDLTEVGFSRTMDLLSTYAANSSDLEGWLADAEINRDRSLRLMYLAGLGLNNYTAASIYSELMEFRSFPARVFTGELGRVQLLRALMGFR
ncbi:MAG: fused MFS/spermidine synthase [Gemmatimonadetes bacterium]|nr:fused MFS/spermidine synthase [Gemmatimonadota bacterium]